MKEYEEVDTEDFTGSDVVFIGGGVVIACLVIAFIFKQIRKTFKNVHIKVGDRIELGIETQEDNKC